MRVVAGSGVARDLSEAEIDRHIEMVSRFVERAKERGQAPLAVTRQAQARRERSSTRRMS
jgi:hypothetical protein